MAVSQNGYRANDRSVIDYYRVPGSSVGFNLRSGAPARVLIYLAQQFDDLVEDIDTAGTYVEDAAPAITGGKASTLRDDWSYAERLVRGGVSLSNHASGTAVDLNSVQHPLGKSGTFTAPQVAEIRTILHDLVDPVTKESVVRWGGNYEGRKDEMHFEIDAGLDAVQRVADRIETGPDGKLFIAKPKPKPVPKPEPAPAFPLPKGHFYGVESDDKQGHSGFYPADRPGIKRFQAQLKERGWDGIGTPDGFFGAKTDEVVRAFQEEKHLGVDGKVGPKTWDAAWEAKVT